MSRSDDELDVAIRVALDAELADVRAGDELLERIHREVSDAPLRAQSGRWAPVAAVAAVLFAAVGTAVVVDDAQEDDDVVAGQIGEAATSTSADPPDTANDKVSMDEVFSVVLPAGWDASSGGQFVQEVEGAERASLTVSTHDYDPVPSAQCDAPVAGLNSMTPDDALVSFREAADGSAHSASRPSAESFLETLETDSAYARCLTQPVHISIGHVGFVEGGRMVEVLLAVGDNASAQTREQLIEIIERVTILPINPSSPDEPVVKEPSAPNGTDADDRTTTSSPSDGRRPVPDLVGIDMSQAHLKMIADGFDASTTATFQSMWVASTAAPTDVILSQDPPAGQPLPAGQRVRIVVSAGGPVISFADLPAEAAQFTTTLEGFDPTEPILRSDTGEGVAFKTDRWLFGPCPAVALAYRTYGDPSYLDKCYSTIG